MNIIESWFTLVQMFASFLHRALDILCEHNQVEYIIDLSEKSLKRVIFLYNQLSILIQ